MSGRSTEAARVAKNAAPGLLQNSAPTNPLLIRFDHAMRFTMSNNQAGLSLKLMLLAGILAGGIFVSPLCAQSAGPASKPPTAGAPYRYRPSPPARAHAYYALNWGIDSFSVKSVEQGEMIRFSYRVVDPEKAKAINDKTIEPFLNAPAAHAQLVIPSLEKVGQLRQSSTPEAGKVYWMAFSNPGRPVKRGDRVNVVIGQFHADGLVVE
jgi:hypothetical protein